MIIGEVRKRAADAGVKLTRAMKKADMILSIQKAEGNFPCFQSKEDYCDQSGCAWGKDCLEKKR